MCLLSIDWDEYFVLIVDLFRLWMVHLLDTVSISLLTRHSLSVILKVPEIYTIDFNAFHAACQWLESVRLFTNRTEPNLTEFNRKMLIWIKCEIKQGRCSEWYVLHDANFSMISYWSGPKIFAGNPNKDQQKDLEFFSTIVYGSIHEDPSTFLEKYFFSVFFQRVRRVGNKKQGWNSFWA